MTGKQNKSKPAKSNEASKKAQEGDSKITFDDFDKLNLKSFGESIIRVIENDTSLSNDQNSCTISLNADFGQGKTTFLEMLKNFIEDKDKNKDADKYTVLFINAWKGDFFKEPIITILSEFLEYLEKNNQSAVIKNKLFKMLGNMIVRGAFLLGEDIIGQYSKTMGVNAEGVKNILKDLRENKESIGKNLFEEFKQRKQALEEIKDIISSYTENGKKLVIIVDELDRARPDYAIHFLEDMKHFFDIENVVFIFGVNKTQMKATVQTLYGEKVGFEGYYRKFFKHDINLPDPYKKTANFINSLLKQTKTDEKFNAANIRFLFKTFQLTLRELSRFIELCDKILSKTAKDDKRNYKYSNSVLFFICLYLKKQATFNKVLNHEFKLDDFLEFVKEIPYDSDEEKYFLTQVAFSFLKAPIKEQDILMDNKQKQELKKFEADIAKIEEKFGKDPVIIISEHFFSDRIDYIIRKEPCLVICDFIQRHKPFYTHTANFQRTIS